MLHIVDLDATLGLGSNLEIIKNILSEISIPVEVAGGLREESLIIDCAQCEVFILSHSFLISRNTRSTCPYTAYSSFVSKC